MTPAPLNPCPGHAIGHSLCNGCARRNEALKGVALIPAVRWTLRYGRYCVNRVPATAEA